MWAGRSFQPGGTGDTSEGFSPSPALGAQARRKRGSLFTRLLTCATCVHTESLHGAGPVRGSRARSKEAHYHFLKLT